MAVHRSPPRLETLGWGERVSARYHDITAGRPGLVPGRVVRVERSACLVAIEDGDRLATSATLPAVGDWVALELRDDAARVVAVVPRWSELSRRDPDTDLPQVLAADVDLVLMTVPGDRPNPARAERESALAWDSGARPVAVVTKSDLAPVGLAADLERRLVGVDVVVTSSVTGEGVDHLAALLAPGATAVLLGPSGAGKSTLANALLGERRFATGDVRAADSRGRHTTTARELVAVPTGGVLIDTPGLRSLGLIGDVDVTAAFADIEALASGCRFRDCSHEQEPGCAVIAAVDDGTLALERLAGLRKLRREVAYERRQVDRAARTAEQQRWKAIHKANRRRSPRPDPRRDEGRRR